MNAFKRITISLLVLLLTLGALGFDAQTAQAAGSTCRQYYTVQRGDYLVKIAREFGVSWRYLAEINELDNPSRIYSGQKLCVDGDGAVDEPSVPDTGAQAEVWASKVVEDSYATIEARDLPANTRLAVLFSRRGDSVSDAIQVGRVRSDRHGELSEDFDIPTQLYDVSRITVRLQTGSRIYAEDWFTNETASGDTRDDDDDRSLQVLEVFAEEDVTIRGRSLPARLELIVRMADREARRVRWIEVDRIETDSRGRFEETFDLPRQLRDANQISIWFESLDETYDVSTWFENRDQDQDEVEDAPDFPFLQAVEVDRDDAVTIRFTNLPADVRFEVLMGKIGTQGVDGILVGIVESGNGGTVDKTFDIPAALEGSGKIAIRMESPSRGLFAYNWFTNQTTR